MGLVIIVGEEGQIRRIEFFLNKTCNVFQARCERGS